MAHWSSVETSPHFSNSVELKVLANVPRSSLFTSGTNTKAPSIPVEIESIMLSLRGHIISCDPTVRSPISVVSSPGLNKLSSCLFAPLAKSSTSAASPGQHRGTAPNVSSMS